MCGGAVGGESIAAMCGGAVGGESIAAMCGGAVGGESIAAMCGGAVGGESVSAKAELATAQPATKAIRLTFIVFTPIELLKVRRCGTPRYDSLRRLKRHPDENSLTLP